MKRNFVRSLAVGLIIYALSSADPVLSQVQPRDTFGSVVKLVDQHSHLIILSDAAGQATIAVWPAMQGRVLTSSADGVDGRSFGWVNRDLVVSGETQPHMNAVGGEDRLWIGPEGGQFSVFFAPHAPFDLDHWYTPAPVDTEPFEVVAQGKTSVSLKKEFSLTNYSGTRFDVRIDREVRLLTPEEIWGHLRVADLPGAKVVGFESVNRLTNLSSSGWNKSTGLLSLWVLGQFNATPSARIVLPIREGSTSKLGVPVTTDYFGTVPADRIAVMHGYIVFKADAQFRSKLGVSPQRSKGMLGSYDPSHHMLTIVQYSEPSSPALYVNSAWKIQQDPFKGDVANCYNDGPPAPEKPQLGSFYEMESSSPAEVLGSHATVEHVHRTIHIVGTPTQLDVVARATLGIPLSLVQLP